MAYYDISCPSCGPLRAESARRLKACPDCGSSQAIILAHDSDIDDRLRREKNEHRQMLQEDYTENALGRMDI